MKTAGSGECVALAPDVIGIDDTGVAHMLVDTVDEDVALRICKACPVGALSIAADE